MRSLLALLSVLAGPPAASPLAGCQVQQSIDGWDYECGVAIRAFVSEYRLSAARATALFEEAVDAFAPAGAAERTRERRTLGGKEAEVVRLAGEGWSQWMALLLDGAGSRTVSCHARGAGEACPAILEALAGQPFGAGPVPAAKRVSPGSLAQPGGRSVPVPEGCEGRYLERGGGELQCSSNRSGWWLLVRGPERGETIVAEERAKLAALARAQKLPLREDEVPCRLAGRQVVCRRQVLGAAAGPAAYTKLTAYADLEGAGVTMVGVCFTLGRTGQDGPCAAVFELR
jgi:hypothetical protein